MENNIKEKMKIIELELILNGRPMPPSKKQILTLWGKKWNDFYCGKTRLKVYRGHLVEFKGQAKKDGEDFKIKFPELDKVLDDLVEEYLQKYVKCTEHNYKQKNVDTFVRNLENYRKSCESELNRMLKRYKGTVIVINTSSYLRNINWKKIRVTRGMTRLATYTVYRRFDNGYKKAVFNGNYKQVVAFIEEYKNGKTPSKKQQSNRECTTI